MNFPGQNYKLAIGVGITALFFAVAGYAQDSEDATEAAEADSGAIEEVLVTGSRIKSPDLTSPSPLQTVGQDLIQDLGAVTIQEALQTNPAFGMPGQSRFVSNNDVTNAGTATVNLRNLGANRTLVLVDGRRMIAGVPGTTQVDLSMIPTNFIDRVEVLTGGASAVYGSDAVAGVVNIIYKKDFEGLLFNIQTGISDESDGEETMSDLTGGANFMDGRGNFMFTIGWSDQSAVDGSRRSFSNDSWSSVGVLTRNSATLFDRTLNRSTVHPDGTMTAGGQNYTFDSNGNAIPWNINDQNTRYNQGGTGGARNIASPVERWFAAARSSFEFTDSIEGIFELNYGRNSSVSAFEPHPYVSSSNILGILAPHNLENRLLNPATGEVRLVRNPFIPDLIYNGNTDTNRDGLRDAQYSKRMVEFGNRVADIDREQFRVVFGVEGYINDDWSYDAYFSHGRTDLQGQMRGLFIMPNMAESIAAAPDVFDFDRDGDVTEAICVDAAARARGCVPINMYGENRISQAAHDYNMGTGYQDSTQEMDVVAANITGPLFDLPAGPLLMAAGAEWRKESSKHLFDPLSNTNQNGYVQLTNTIGSQDVSELYTELRAPIFDGLTISGAYRWSDYSTLDNSFSAYNFGLEWRPIDSLLFRGVYAHAVRAPNIGELFSAPAAGVTSVTDPCQGVTVSGTSATAINCLADPGVLTNANSNGGTVVFIQSDFQGVQTLSAPNPDITEETGDTWTAGLVFTPDSIAGLALTVDYYNIEIEDAISRVTTSTVLNKCYREGLQNFCDFVDRRTVAAVPYSAGSISLLKQGLVNSGGLFNEGVDFTADYSFDLGPGSLGTSFSYTHVFDQGIYPLTGDPVDNYKGEVGFPEDKAFLALTYDIGNWNTSLTTSYIGASYLDDVFVKGLFPTADPTSGEFEIDSEIYIGTQVGYTFAETYNVYFGINNLMDEDPPPLWGGLPGTSGNASTNQGLYDVIGRFYYVGLRIAAF